MGLNAVVYKNRSHLAFDPDSVGAKVDPRTGEFYLKDNGVHEFGQDAAVALGKRLGNMDAIALLSDAIGQALGTPESLLQKKILFSGTHSGDVIDLAEFDRLRGEIARVRRSTIFSQVPGLVEFIQSIDDLVRVASSEENPIVFV